MKTAFEQIAYVCLIVGIGVVACQSAVAQPTAYQSDIQPLLKQFCNECHQGDDAEAEVDLAGFESIQQIRSRTDVWLRVRQMLDSRQMPPKDAQQLSEPQWQLLTDWVREFLQTEALAQAGDPGPVTLRRLSNAEYAYTIQDLTGVESLDPGKEFPVDGAAGEGFTNAGDALVMSPALLTKYLDAAKQIAQHAVVMPEGIRFSQHTSRRDWTDAALDRIRDFYHQFVDDSGAYLDWEGKNKDTPSSGRIPLRAYIQALRFHRQGLQSGSVTIQQVAIETNLNPKYLNHLWSTFSGDHDKGFVLNKIQELWSSAADAESVEAEIERWQQLLWQFNSIGHLGRKGAPKHWMTARDPLIDRQRIALDLPTIPTGQPQVIYLSVWPVDGEDAVVAWRTPTLQKPGRTPVLLRDVKGKQDQLRAAQHQFHSKLTRYLQAADEVLSGAAPEDVLQTHALDRPTFDRWLAYLGIGDQSPVVVSGHFSERLDNIGGHPLVSGWGSPNTPSIAANSSDQQVRVPGILSPRSIAVHPSPQLFSAVGWQSPIDGTITVNAAIADAHPECGNGVEWFLQHRSGSKSSNVDQGNFATGGQQSLEQVRLAVAKGDLVSLIIGPRDGEHTCDLTSVQLVIHPVDQEQPDWDLAAQVSPDIQAGNPHADSFGHDSVWHFYAGPVTEIGKHVQEPIPEQSLLARWKRESDPSQRRSIAVAIQSLAQGGAAVGEADSVLQKQLNQIVDPASIEATDVPIDQRFGQHPDSLAVPDTDLFLRAGDTLAFDVPAELASGGLFSTEVEIVSTTGNPVVQVSATLTEPQWSPSSMNLGLPILVRPGELQRKAVTTALERFRDLFPASLCYSKIVPVDEVVTLQLYYREDDHFQRLMCDDMQQAELDRLWDELLFIAEEPLASEIALEQIQAFATQDRPDLVPEFEELKVVYRDRGDAFRRRLIELEPQQLESLIDFAARAWRRNLSDAETNRLRSSYTEFRSQDMSHDNAIRLLLARILVAPSFLYRLEQPGAGAATTPVSDDELATRLSYFLWSSTPDQVLRSWAQSGALQSDQVLVNQSRRLLNDPQVRRMAIHFACQWLHVRDFDKTVEKNERLYPEFNQLRPELYEEVVRFFEDMFRGDGSILGLVSADHTFMNQRLAEHYGVTGITGDQWRRVDGTHKLGRGGVLGMATVLASQSGASRTSPILRGNWIYETLLGERLPRPPAGIPQLPDIVPSDKTARELIELHSSAPECAKCHVKIDPYGFALEQFDTVGRLRSTTMDTKTSLPDGRSIEGLDGLRAYLLDQRREDIVYQFCKKLLGYALGREVQLSDEPLLEQMQKRLAHEDYRFSIAVESIVTSSQFRQIRGRLAAPESVVSP